jgi:hypothetical protein
MNMCLAQSLLVVEQDNSEKHDDMLCCFRFVPGIETIDEHMIEFIASQLEILNLRNNELSTSTQLGFLTHLHRLREFYVDYNRLESIDQVTWPNKLKIVSLKNNQLTQVDLSMLTRIEQLEKFSLSSNKLTKLLPTTACHLSTVELLELDRNHLSILPILNAPKLRTFNLDGNFLGKTIDDKMFSQMPVLERVHLRDNRIETIDYRAFEHTRLQSLGKSTIRVCSRLSMIFIGCFLLVLFTLFNE